VTVNWSVEGMAENVIESHSQSSPTRPVATFPDGRMQSYRIPAHLIPAVKAKASHAGITVTSVVVDALTNFVEDTP